MGIKFYTFNAKVKKDSITILPKINYEEIEILDKKTLLIEHNKFTVVEGQQWLDLIRFDGNVSFAISKKVKELFENNKLTGWGSFPIIIEGVTKEYFGFQNLSKAGPIINLDALNNYETEFTEFDITTWDGSDIFHLQGTVLNVCTSRVKEILEKEKITGIEITPL